MMIKEFSYRSIDAAAKALAEELAITLKQAIKIEGRAYAALSGGRTPRHVFQYLRQFEIEWSRVVFTLTDERWVRPDHPESNEQLVRKYLLQGPLKDATFISLYSECDDLKMGETNCEIKLQKIKYPFDAVYLGMGEDGHFASLFPKDNALGVRDKMCVAIPKTHNRIARISLTVPRILNTKKIYLLFNGKKKKEAYDQAKTASSYHHFPIQLILCQKNVPVNVLLAP